MTATRSSRRPTGSERNQPGWRVRGPRLVALVGGVVFVAFGLWGMVDPESFHDFADFDPYNQHYLQDIGAFQIGLGAVLVLAALRERADALAVALLGVAVGSFAHLVSHAVGTDLGGTPETDIPAFAVVTVLLAVAGLLRWSDTAPPRSRA